MERERGSLLWEGDFVAWAGPASVAASVPIPEGHPGVVQSLHDAAAVGVWWVGPQGYLSFDEIYDQDWLERISAEHYRVQADQVRAGLVPEVPDRDSPYVTTASADSRFGEDDSCLPTLRATDRPWVRHELPWLRSGPLFGIDPAARDGFGCLSRPSRLSAGEPRWSVDDISRSGAPGARPRFRLPILLRRQLGRFQRLRQRISV